MKINIIHTIQKYPKKSIVFIIVCISYYFSLPKQIFKAPTSTVITDKSGELLGATIASDGQWRFPELDSVPRKFKECIIQFEDAYFYNHFGFNPASIGKAFLENRKAKRVVRGGSTLTQQVIRLSRKNQQRSYVEKLKELILATRLEFRYSKEKILKLYASHAPYGGNVVGLEMASWRYFRLQPHQLSWAESATLAVLPNAPSLIYPGKNQQKLKNKRDRLLQKLYQKNIIDSLTYVLATEEELPQKPHHLPTVAPHFVQKLTKKHKGERLESSIDIHLQEKVNYLAKRHYEKLKQNEVYNLAVLVLDVETRKVLAYVGNSPTDKKHQKDVDNVISARSTGSTLKPFLFAYALQSGDLLPTQLLKDTPVEIAGYTPKNFNLSYDGAVHANEALTRSLNIPAVRMLRSYGLQKFREDLKSYNINGIDKSADYYGLSLILGGAEANLWDLCKIFAGYAGTVNHYEDLKHKYYSDEFQSPLYLKNQQINFGTVTEQTKYVDAGSTYLTLNTLTEVNRPTSDQAWKYYDSSQKIAWKTGTSFGNKDAWAIGTTSKYVVGVWCGNSDGEGRPDLTGVGSASPLMFGVFDVLPKSDWFLEPYEDLIEEEVCVQTGYLALPICTSEKRRIQKNGIRAKSCPYHKEIQLDKTESVRVNSNCESVQNMITKTWFILPPVMGYYYKQKNPNYQKLPDFKAGCTTLDTNTIDFVFPTKFRSIISLTKGTNGEENPVILKLTHTNPNATVYWYLDDVFITETNDYHEIPLKPSIGEHVITVIDGLGNEKKCVIEVE
ncbi:penicillin-binding protein 1C [Tenacibaculum sp. M341]|uniref:penicillin-binding protein 1C n=1 Tax=Tenacibaculum sp. M341 TaxID=2530339 RepID=UPI00105218D5|nr:penicillin-binding protein 1C [Tenacibaculum sp. M341]TCI85088.1 penicillin-binding protein 1C [Tenacibaculum sp. M341]